MSLAHDSNSNTEALLIQTYAEKGTLFLGATYENFGHVVLCGLGGIFVEILKTSLQDWLLYLMKRPIL